MSIRSRMAQGMGRTVRFILRDIMHRNASQLPGRIALTLDPKLIGHLRSKPNLGSVVVCGTNGKTTTTNIIAAALQEGGASVFCNRDGANMAPGVASTLLERGGCDWAVFEVDELSTIHVVPSLHPRYVLLLNLFRDQLDRAGEIEHVQDTLVSSLQSSPETVLVTCADDPLCMGVADRLSSSGTKVLTFGIDEDLGIAASRVPEARFCQHCGEELAYTSHTYAQMGHFSCPKCGFRRPQPDFRATNVHASREGVSLDVSLPNEDGAQRMQASLSGVYMAYNLLAAASLVSLTGADLSYLQSALDGYDPHNGRLQHFLVGGREVVLNLAKNPTGFNQNIQLLLTDDRHKSVYIVINDNYNDGRDVSWLWDVDFELLQDRSDTDLTMVGGLRANDMQVRLKYAGIESRQMTNVSEAVRAVREQPKESPLYVLTNYSALQPARVELERMGERDGIA